MQQSHTHYPTFIAYDGLIRYVGPDGYGYPTVERLERWNQPV